MKRPSKIAGEDVQTLGNPRSGEMTIKPHPTKPGKVYVTTLFPSDQVEAVSELKKRSLWDRINDKPCPEFLVMKELYELQNSPSSEDDYQQISQFKTIAGHLVAKAALSLDGKPLKRLEASRKLLKEWMGRDQATSLVSALRDAARFLALKLQRFPTKDELRNIGEFYRDSKGGLKRHKTKPKDTKTVQYVQLFPKGEVYGGMKGFSKLLKQAGLSFLPENHSAKGPRKDVEKRQKG